MRCCVVSDQHEHKISFFLYPTEGSALSAEIEKRRNRVIRAHGDGLYGKVNVRRKREKGDEGAREAPRSETGTCFVCGDESASGASCLNSNHFICGDCVDGQHEAWKNTYPLRLASGIRCAHDNCGSTYDNRELRACMSDASDAIRMQAYSGSIQMQARAESLARTKKDSLQMTVSVWLLDRSTESAVAKLRAHVEDDILMNKCPRCALPFGDFTACTAVACESDIAGQVRNEYMNEHNNKTHLNTIAITPAGSGQRRGGVRRLLLRVVPGDLRLE